MWAWPVCKPVNSPSSARKQKVIEIARKPDISPSSVDQQPNAMRWRVCPFPGIETAQDNKPRRWSYVSGEPDTWSAGRQGFECIQQIRRGVRKRKKQGVTGELLCDGACQEVDGHGRRVICVGQSFRCCVLFHGHPGAMNTVSNAFVTSPLILCVRVCMCACVHTCACVCARASSSSPCDRPGNDLLVQFFQVVCACDVYLLVCRWVDHLSVCWEMMYGCIDIGYMDALMGWCFDASMSRDAVCRRVDEMCCYSCIVSKCRSIRTPMYQNIHVWTYLSRDISYRYVCVSKYSISIYRCSRTSKYRYLMPYNPSRIWTSISRYLEISEHRLINTQK